MSVPDKAGDDPAASAALVPMPPVPEGYRLRVRATPETTERWKAVHDRVAHRD